MTDMNLAQETASTIRSLIEKTASQEKELSKYKIAFEKACEELTVFRRKEQAEKLADQMIDLGILADSDRQEKIAELLGKNLNIDQLKMAVEQFNPNNQWGSVDSDGEADTNVKTSQQILEDFNEWLRSKAPITV